MSSKTPKDEPKASPSGGKILERNITTEMRESYLDYAMSVITSRALPDVRDGLKPVHRRILFAMHEAGLTASAKTRKSATVVGDVIGRYHPHGEVAVYEAMVKLAQDFATRYPLIIGQGNFGSIDGDSAAAYRYTEAKMSRLSGEMLRDLEKDTVDFRPNYDSTRREPVVLPAAAPNLLLNGTLGIAVGMASNIPPHNLREVAAAAIHLADNPRASTEDLLQFIQGPDFPTGGIVYGAKDLEHCYNTGKGAVVVRGEAEIVENKNGQFQIVISSIPYRVNKSELIVQIADLVREKKLEGIKGLRDESTKDIRVVVDLKQGSQPQAVLNYLYKHTQLEEPFHYNMVALTDGVPETMSLKWVLEEFLDHRREVIKRRTQFDLSRAKEREHILLGLKKALDHIDAIIKLIKASKDVDTARANLMKEFRFSEIQANAILEMRLQKLAGLERKKVEEELAQVKLLIKELEELLGSDKKMLTLIKKEIGEVGEKYGDERKTRVVKHAAKEFKMEDLVPEEDSILVYTSGGYVKRTNPNEYRKQKRGGVGVVDLDTKEEDFITQFLTTSTHDDLLFFTDKGKVYQIKMYELPEGRRATKGKSIMNYLALSAEEKVTSILPFPKSAKGRGKEASVMLVTKSGYGKKVAAEHFEDVRRSGIIAIKLSAGDALVGAFIVEAKDTVIVGSSRGQSIRFKESDVRQMGRTAGGVRVLKLGKGDSLVAADVISNSLKDPELLVISRNGFGKRTSLKEYKVQRRGGSGIKTAKVTDKTGPVITGKVVVADPETEVIAISKKSQVIRTGLDGIPSLSRATQGVRVMKLRDGDSIASLVCF